MINQKEIQAIFDYKDGTLYWKNHKYRKLIGKEAGTKDSKGYIIVGLFGKRYKAHRIIFMLFHGYLPEYLDHIDGNPSNNIIDNLRAATMSENHQNKRIQKNNRSGYKNVYWHAKKEKWDVRISVNNTIKFIGTFDDLELADLVAQEARDKYNGEFARHA